MRQWTKEWVEKFIISTSAQNTDVRLGEILRHSSSFWFCPLFCPHIHFTMYFAPKFCPCPCPVILPWTPWKKRARTRAKTARRTGTFRKTKKWVIWAQNPFFGNAIQIFRHHHDGTPKRQGFCVEPVAQWASGRPPRPIFGLKIFIFLRYTHITPIFWGQTDPTQWDLKSPISWGNSG